MPGWPTGEFSYGKFSARLGGIPAKSSEIPPRQAGSLFMIYMTFDNFPSLDFNSQNRKLVYNQFHNILRLFDVLPNFPLATSKTMSDYYLSTW